MQYFAFITSVFLPCSWYSLLHFDEAYPKLLFLWRLRKMDNEYLYKLQKIFMYNFFLFGFALVSVWENIFLETNYMCKVV